MRDNAIGAQFLDFSRRAVERYVADKARQNLQLVVAGHIDGPDVRHVQLGRGHIGGIKVQGDIRHTVQRDDTRRQLDEPLVVAARLKLPRQVKVRHGQAFQRADGAGRASHFEGLLAQRIVQAFDIETVRRADEIHFQRQLAHLVDRQRHVGGVAVHRGVLRCEHIAFLVAQFQHGGHCGRVGQFAIDLHRSHDAGHLVQFARRAAQRNFGGHGGGAVQHIAGGNRHGGGIHRDRDGFLADLVKHNVDGLGAFDRAVDIAGEIGGVRHAGLQAQRDFARTADARVAGVDHDIRVLNVANDGAVALDLDGNALNVRLFHDIQALGRVGGRAACVVDGHVCHDFAALRVNKNGNDRPGNKAQDDGQHHCKNRVVPNRARAFGRCALCPRHAGFIRICHGSVRLPCAAAFAGAKYFRPRPPPGERSPPAID